MNEIREFIQSHSEFSFDEGFSLLERYCANPGVVSFLARKRDIKHLSYELGRLARLPRLTPLKDVHAQAAVNIQPEKSEENAGQVKRTEKPSAQEKTGPIRWKDLNHHKNTKYEDMPTDYLKTIYKQNRDLYKEFQYSHSQMKLANSDAGRADWRSKVLRLAVLVTKYWKIIDDEIERLKEPPRPSDNFKETSCRGYISKKLNKGKLKPEEIIEVRKKFEQLELHGCTIKEDTLEKLRNLGVV